MSIGNTPNASHAGVEGGNALSHSPHILDLFAPASNSPPAEFPAKSNKRPSADIQHDSPDTQDENTSSERLIVEGSVTKKRRGRPAGLTKQPHWKPQGRPKKSRKIDVLFTSTHLASHRSLLSSDREAEDVMNLRTQIAADETPYLFTVQYTWRKCMESDDAIKWIEADDRERLALEAMKTWRHATQDDYDSMGDKLEIVPSACIYSKKRDGRFKCRLVALGNRQRLSLSGEIYSPCVSHPAQRFVLVEAAAQNWSVRQFDITNAFVSASLGDECVLVRLPKHHLWSKDKQKGDVVRLLKSLYGLKISPRRWYDHYARVLRGLKWVSCPAEPGVFRKTVVDESGVEHTLLLSIYVDDCVIAGASDDVVRQEMQRILVECPGKEILPDMEGSTEVRDLLGATLRYNAQEGYMKISAESAIDKLLKKFNMTDCRPLTSPVVAQGPIESPPNTTFPLRTLVGSLLYLSTTCRPDIAFATQKLATRVESPTDNDVKNGKRILAYLKGTKDQGLVYSKENEENFRTLYTAAVAKEEKQYRNTVAFSDADYAGCRVSFKSTSGSIIYRRGTPIAWRSKKQSIRALSTMEAEYCAIYGTIRLSLDQGYHAWLCENEKRFPLLFNDNTSALMLGRTSVATKRSKHMDLRLHLVRDYFQDLCYIKSADNKADGLTKAVPPNTLLGIFATPHRDPNPDVALAYFMDFAQL